jgi:hypothetical protein
LRDVFGRVTKSYLENLVELSPELMKVIEMGITCRATCGFDGVSEKNELQTVENTWLHLQIVPIDLTLEKLMTIQVFKKKMLFPILMTALVSSPKQHLRNLCNY